MCVSCGRGQEDEVVKERGEESLGSPPFFFQGWCVHVGANSTTSNCNSCRNYVKVTPWYDVGYKMCKMYKLLQLPFVAFKTPGMFDTSIAQSCRFYSQVNVVLDEEIEYLIL